MEWMDYRSLLEIITVFLGLFGLVILFLVKAVDKWPRRLSIAILSITILSSVFALLERIAGFYHFSLFWWKTIHLGVILTSPLPSLFFFVYFLYYCNDDWKKDPLMYIMSVLTGSLIVVQVLVGYVFKIGFMTDYTIDFRPWSLLCLFLILALTAVLLIALFRKRKKLSPAEQIMFLACFLMPSYLQTLFIEALLMIGLDRSYQFQKEEAERQRMRAAVLQMRPHFIHNTMMTIYSLCAQDPQKARQVTKDFATYLHNNFTAIVQEDRIPFTKELEHAQAYLNVEMARFEGQLFVTFDTPVTLFLIPPLTLQPIVENAVKHGIDPELDPLHISITTEEASGGVRIIVEDDGIGYAPKEGNEPHIALNNIRERLRALCGGTLEISPREEHGTRVVVFIPNKTGTKSPFQN